MPIKKKKELQNIMVLSPFSKDHIRYEIIESWVWNSITFRFTFKHPQYRNNGNTLESRKPHTYPFILFFFSFPFLYGWFWFSFSPMDNHLFKWLKWWDGFAIIWSWNGKGWSIEMIEWLPSMYKLKKIKVLS